MPERREAISTDPIADSIDHDAAVAELAALPSLWPYLIGSAIVALFTTLGSIHRDHHSDSVLNVLISLQLWTPFVWEQDRFGMLVPLLALPIKHPLGNMVFQAFLSITAGLATFYLLARFAFRDRTYPLVGTIGAASLLALTSHYYRFELLVDTSYGTSLSLALWALILVEPSARVRTWPGVVGALFLMAVSHWVNSVTAYFIGPVVFLNGFRRFDSPAKSTSDWRKFIRALARFLSPSGTVRRPTIAELKSTIARIPSTPLDPFCGRLKMLVGAWWRIETVRALVVLTFGFECGHFFISLSPYQPTTYSAQPPSFWLHGWWELLRTNHEELGKPFWVIAMGIELALGVFGLVRNRSWRTDAAWWSAGSLILTAVALWLLIGTRTWTWINAYAFRYLFPSALLVQTAVAGLAMASFGTWFPSQKDARAALAALATGILLVLSTWNYGFPSMAGVRRDVDRNLGALTEDLLAGHCTCLAGDYWKVWISVFHANLVLYEKGSPQKFWGMTFRSGPTYALWKDEPIEHCVAAVSGHDNLGQNWLKSYGLPQFELVEIRRTIRVYRPIPRSRRSP